MELSRSSAGNKLKWINPFQFRADIFLLRMSKRIIMVNKLRTLLVLIIVTLALANELFSEDTPQAYSGKEVFFDAVCFKSLTDDTTARLDVYATVPYSALFFKKIDQVFGAQYELTIKITDTNGIKIKETTKSYNIIEKDYSIAQGSTGKFDFTQSGINLPSGNYEIEATVSDAFSKLNYTKSRKITVIDFSKYPFSISGLMLVNAIEDDGTKRVITPHLTDNIGELTDGFFIFFEFYKRVPKDAIDFVYDIVNDKGIKVFTSKRLHKEVIKTTSQHYIKIDFPRKLNQGAYTIRLTALNPSNKEEYANYDILAITERSIRYYRSIAGNIMTDIDKAIKQLRYVATSDELDYIEAGTTNEDRTSRFEEFWKKHDPTPNTELNEAFEQYYMRIDYANKNFKSYSEGWRSDKGNVYVVYGQPSGIEKQNSTSDNRVFERWTYNDNRQFVFVDNNGFGDFKLYQPYLVSEKYKYQSP